MAPISEWDLIAALEQRLGAKPPEVILGIGDDCAAITAAGDEALLWTVDTLVEGVHFKLSHLSLTQLGWKTMAVNVSDIAAMGGEPRFALLSLGWPPGREPSGAMELAEGLAAAGEEFGVAIIGGDTVASPAGLTITLPLLGVVPPSQMVRRSGAQVGDEIYVTGDLGEAAAGLMILQQEINLPPALQDPLITAQIRPRAQVRTGRLLASERLATAMIDTSDGVATDLYHICRASGVGARIDAADVPVSPRVRQAAPHLGYDPLDLALTGGEDYLLLFTSSPAVGPHLKGAFAAAGLEAPRFLGKIVAGSRVILISEAGEMDISGHGFDHFRT